jgi:hypothetical protein
MNTKLLSFFALLLQTLLTARALGASVSYSDFASPTNLIFQAHARLVGDFVRLTPSHSNTVGRVGGLWLQSKQAVVSGFETTFQFRISEKVRDGADGFALVLQDRATPSVGLTGHHLGFIRGGAAFAVKFVDYHWHRGRWVKYDEIAVTSCGGEEKPEALGHPLGVATGPELFSDGKVHTVRVRYTPGSLLVFLDDLQKPLLTAAVELEDYVPFKNGLAWVGITASTGGSSQNQDILSWTFQDARDMATTPLRLANASAGAQPNGVGGASLPAQPNAAPAASQPQVFTLPVSDGRPSPRQPHLGLPSGVGLTHQVYASSDLRTWTLVTNLTLYFSDPAATDYDHRFYAFRPE